MISRTRVSTADRLSLPARAGYALAALLVAAAVCSATREARAAQGEIPYLSQIDGELWIWSGLPQDWASAYPSQQGYDLAPLSDSASRFVTGCSALIELNATPLDLRTRTRLQSEPGPGCAGSSVQGVARVDDTLRFWASPGNIGDPLRLDMEFDFPGAQIYAVDGWPSASAQVDYGLEIILYEVAQTYPDQSVEWGFQLGEVVARRELGPGSTPHQLVNLGDLELVPHDVSGEFGPAQKLTLRISTERGAQIFLRWMLYSRVSFDNQGMPEGTTVATLDADLGGLELISAVVRDPSDESIVTDSGLSASSGFDYLALPEPGSGLLGATALICLLALRRRPSSQMAR